MSQSQHTFAHGRYSKRRRAEVIYCLVDSQENQLESQEDSQDAFDILQPDFDSPKPKKRKISTSPENQKEEKPFPFLELPAEIRNVIYDLALRDPSGINFVSTITKKRRTIQRVSKADFNIYGGGYSYGTIQRDDEDSPVTLVPSLLAVNKQIHKEARDILYDQDFTVADPMALHSFMINLGPRAATYVKRITLGRWVLTRGTFKAYNHAGLAMLSWATNLQRLRLDGSLGCHHSGKWAAHQFYRDGFSWLETYGVHKGRTDAAVDVIDIGQGVFSHRSSTDSSDPSFNEKVVDFHYELRKLLNAQRDRIMSRPSKRVVKAKVSEGDVSPEENEDWIPNEIDFAEGEESEAEETEEEIVTRNRGWLDIDAVVDDDDDDLNDEDLIDQDDVQEEDGAGEQEAAPLDF